MTVTLTEGVKNMRADIDEMTKLFRFSGWIRFRHIVIPQLSPYLIASLRTGISNAWKVALVTEIFGISNGIGYQIILSFYQFSSSLIYAWTIGFTLIILVLDAIMVKLASLALNRFVRFS
jgi:NitT/TauT family transport system permease protein